MTIIKNHKDYTINGKKFFIEQYRDKEMKDFMWRYGYYDRVNGWGFVIGKCLRSRPNPKRIRLFAAS